LSGSFDIVRNMRVAPISMQQLLTLAIAAVLPALPLVFFVVSLNDLIFRGVKTFLHM
jgi:hypothetical protein